MKEYPKPNKHGVYTAEEIVTFKKERINAAVRLVQVNELEWKFSTDVQLPNEGYGYAPHIQGKSFASRDKAFFKGLAEIRKFCEKKHDYPDAAKLIIKWTKSFNQGRLF